MPHPVLYRGNLNDLVKKWDKQREKDWAEDQSKITFIADGQCARLPQALTSVGHTTRWQPGDRVVDVARTLKPGTVIANFKLVDGKWKYPNEHGYHAAIFVRGEGFSVETGKPSQIICLTSGWVPRRTDRMPPATAPFGRERTLDIRRATMRTTFLSCWCHETPVLCRTAPCLQRRCPGGQRRMSEVLSARGVGSGSCSCRSQRKRPRAGR